MGVCPQCQGERLVKHGSAAGKPKKRCKQWGFQFTRTTPRGQPLATKINAVLWYLRGLSMPRMAFLLRVSPQAVLAWIRDLATASYEKPEPTERTIVLQLDEMWHYLIIGCEFSAAQELLVLATGEGDNSIRKWCDQKNAENSNIQPDTKRR